MHIYFHNYPLGYNSNLELTSSFTSSWQTIQLTPGTKIKIVDKPTNGSILIYLEVDVLEGDEVYSQYELQLAARSNGGDQNTIEIQKAKKK